MEDEHAHAKFVGSKAAPGVANRIINLIPPHAVFIEPFAGQGTIARTIKPCGETIFVDRVRQPALVDALREIPRSVFVQGCGIGFLDAYRYKGNEFVYADPPYLLAARAQRGRAYYAHEMSDRDHARLLRVLRAINCRVLLSGYHSPLYDDALADWNTIEFQTMTRGGTLAMEVLWFNYPRPTVLHDFRFVGDDWHARTRLKKKIRRAVADLVSMPPLERGAMFEAMREAMAMPSPKLASTAALSESGEPAGN